MPSGLLSVPTPIMGSYLLERIKRGDARGYFERIFCADTLREIGWDGAIAQINHSYTEHAGVVRGMHYQGSPNADYKLVSCLRGEVWDVVLDLRQGSTTFLQWHGVHLSADNGKALFIPHGCAHGFQTLTTDVELLYCHSAPYAPESEGGVAALDTKFNIAWPLPIRLMSEKDQSYLPITADYQGVSL